MTILRPLFGVLLALSVALTAGMVGAARGQAQVAGQMVICSGQGVVTITVDAEGNPTGPVHVCPDCVLSFLAAAEAAPLADLTVPGWSFADWAPAPHAHRSGGPVVAPMARGPPSLV